MLQSRSDAGQHMSWSWVAVFNSCCGLCRAVYRGTVTVCVCVFYLLHLLAVLAASMAVDKISEGFTSASAAVVCFVMCVSSC